jgi:hypothetical protein
MTSSSSSSTRFPSLPSQQPTTPAPAHLGAAPAAALQTPEGMPAARRAAPLGPLASTQPRTEPLPATPHGSRLPATPATATATATAGPRELATLPHDLGKPLALATDNHAALQKEIRGLRLEAGHARARWLAGGKREDLTATQTLGIQGAVLNGLCSFQFHHRDGPSQTPTVSPETLGGLLPLFRHALHLCQKNSDAVQFPIDSSPHAELQQLHAQVRESLQSLVDGQWQATVEGAGYAQKHPRTLRDPFARLQAAGQELDQVLTHLRPMLISGPAPRPTEAETVAQASRLQGLPAQAPPGAATSSPALVRSYMSVLSANLPAAGSARMAPGRPDAAPVPSSPTATIAAPLPVDPAAEAAAQLRQAQLAALQAALAPLQDEAHRRSEAAEAVASHRVAGDQPWDLHARQFKAWEAVVEAYDACTDKLKAEVDTLKAEAGTSSVLDSEGPAVRSLQEQIDKASGHALDRAAQAATDTQRVFSENCEKIFALDELSVGSAHATLAEHGRELDRQWQVTPLRPRLSALEARMGQYHVYGLAASAMDNAKPDSSGKDLLSSAEQLHQAATLSRRAFEGTQDHRMRDFHKFCLATRRNLLEDLMFKEADNVNDTFHDLRIQLRQAWRKSVEVTTFCDALLIDAPLPQVRAPGSPAALVQDPRPALPEADRSLIDAARQAADAAREQCEQAIELPAHDVPKETLQLQQGVWRVLNQMKLSMETTADVLERFHLLAKTLGTTPHEDRPALVQEHAGAMKQRAADLREALGTSYAAPNGKRCETLRGLVAASQNQLGADLRLVQRTHVSLRTLEQLLDTRMSARRLHGELEQNRRPDLAGSLVFNGQAHDTISQAQKKAMESVAQDLQKEESKLRRSDWLLEKNEHDLAASNMQDKIECERALIQGQFLLALDARASSPGPDHPGRPEHRLDRAEVTELFNSLTETNRTLKVFADRPEHKDRYLAQHAVNDQVRRGLLILILKLNDLDSPPTGTAAGGSSQVNAPAARPSGTTPDAAEASEGSKSSRRHRPARRK